MFAPSCDPVALCFEGPMCLGSEFPRSYVPVALSVFRKSYAVLGSIFSRRIGHWFQETSEKDGACRDSTVWMWKPGLAEQVPEHIL